MLVIRVIILVFILILKLPSAGVHILICFFTQRPRYLSALWVWELS
jgi:hypothetical protein